MMKLPKALQNSFIYTILMVLQKGISFFLLPIYTYYLSPADYGILGVVNSISSLLSILISFGVSGAATRFYYKHIDEKDYWRRLFGTIALVILFNTVTYGSIFLFGHSLFIDPIAKNIDFYPFILVGLLNVLFTPLYNFFQDYLQTVQDGKKYGINSMLFFVVNMTLIIMSLTVFHLGVVGVLLSGLITSVIFFLYVIATFLPKLRLRIDKVILKDSLKYSIPLIPHTLANWSNGTLDKLLVNGIRSKADAGLYNLGQQYGSVLSFIVNGVNQAFVPWFYQKVNEGDAGYSHIRRVSEASVCIVSLIGIIMAIFSKEILAVMIHNSAYSEVWTIVPCVVFAYVFQLLYYFFVSVLFLNETKYVFTITVTSVIMNIIFNLILIPLYGFVGCAIACLLTYLTKSVMALMVSVWREKIIRFRWHVMYGMSLLGLTISLSSIWLANIDFVIGFLIKIVLCGSFSLYILINYRNDVHNIKSLLWKK